MFSRWGEAHLLLRESEGGGSSFKQALGCCGADAVDMQGGWGPRDQGCVYGAFVRGPPAPWSSIPSWERRLYSL